MQSAHLVVVDLSLTKPTWRSTSLPSHGIKIPNGCDHHTLLMTNLFITNQEHGALLCQGVGHHCSGFCQWTMVIHYLPTQLQQIGCPADQSWGFLTLISNAGLVGQGLGALPESALPGTHLNYGLWRRHLIDLEIMLTLQYLLERQMDCSNLSIIRFNVDALYKD